MYRVQRDDSDGTCVLYQMRLSRTCKALVPLRGQVWELATWSPTIATALAQGQLPSLTHIRIDHRRLGPEGAALLLPHAEHSHPVLLVSLHLWNTGLGARGTQVRAGRRDACHTDIKHMPG